MVETSASATTSGATASEHDVGPAPSLRRRLGPPLAVAVVLVGIALSGAAWLGLRSVERNEAVMGYERVLLTQSSQINAEMVQTRVALGGLAEAMTAAAEADPIHGAVEAFDAQSAGAVLASTGTRELVFLETVGDATDEINLIEREQRAGNQRFVDGYGTGGDGERPVMVVSRIRPAGWFQDAMGTDVSHDPVAERVLAGDAAVQVRTSGEADGLFSRVYGGLARADDMRSPDPGAGEPTILLAAPVGEGGRHGLVATRVFINDVVGASGPLALAVSRDGVVLATTMAMEELGRPVGAPTSFVDQNAEWSIQGFSAGVVADHRGSWVALVAGLGLALIGGLFSASAQRYAVTLGRLERSEHDARHDRLTGLVNRAGITEALSDMLEDRNRNELVGVLFLDLDRLKIINDSMGHSAGDEVLQIVAQRLRSLVRDGDVVGRFGGDEFVIASRGLRAISDLERSADRVLTALRDPVVLADESSQTVSASIGIAYVSSGGAGISGAGGEETGWGTDSAEALLRDADLAMYRAKENGGARYSVFDTELRTQALARLEVERELRRAIRTGQLVVHYQPIIDIRTGQVDRLEALVRWQHPVRGMVPPGQFLSVAAESGLIIDVGEHVLREACRQVGVWSAAVGRDICVSVNVAERQLMDSGLLDTVRRVLAETGVSPSQLELELTEELMAEKLDRRLSILRDLEAMGIKLAIDDFGTSRASLGQLKRLDMVATLKIDRAFVIDVASDPVDRKIITAIVALADSMGMEVVAEGVEDPDQVLVLQELGVNLIQGFYFERPGPSEKMIGLLRKTFAVPQALPAAPTADDSL